MKKLFILFLSCVLLFTMISCDTGATEQKTEGGETTAEATTETKEETTMTEAPCNHNFKDATCASPKTCTECGATEGGKLPHQPDGEPTCTKDSVCTVCNKVTARSFGHDYKDKVCTRCGESEPVIRVACIGDSITAGKYWLKMSDYLVPEYVVSGYGVSGSTGFAAGLDGNPPKPLAYVDQPEHTRAKASNPDIVVILLGTNDSKDMNANRIKADQGEQYKKDMISLVNEYKNLESHPQIFLALPPVSFRPETGGISNVNIENLIIPLLLEVAEETGAIVIDTHEATKGQNEAFPDGVHPNDQGKDLLAKTIAEAILLNEIPPEID